VKNISPLKNYSAPNIPTLEAARENPELLKKLPRRWQKKAAVAACTGIIGLAVFLARLPKKRTRIRKARTFLSSSVAEAIVQLETAELVLRTHYGGSGAGPHYVAYFTEQEAYGFIRAMLEESGFNFSAPPPSYSIDTEGDSLGRIPGLNIGLDLFDAEKEIAVVFIGERGGGGYSARKISEAFLEQHGLHTGVFQNPGESVFGTSQAYWGWIMSLWEEHVGGDIYDDSKQDIQEFYATLRDQYVSGDEAFNTLWDKLRTTREPEIRNALIEKLTEQTQNFIEQLHTDGVLNPSQENEIPRNPKSPSR